MYEDGLFKFRLASVSSEGNTEVLREVHKNVNITEQLVNGKLKSTRLSSYTHPPFCSTHPALSIRPSPLRT